jgi:hypothetical protein
MQEKAVWGVPAWSASRATPRFPRSTGGVNVLPKTFPQKSSLTCRHLLNRNSASSDRFEPSVSTPLELR